MMNRKFLTGLLLCLGLVTLFGAGCAKPAAPTKPLAASSVTAACDMLTLSDATQILGGNVSSSQNGTVPSGQSTAFTMCQYSSLDMNRSLNLLVRQSSSAEEAAAIYGQAKKNAPIMSGIAVQDVPGLGDGAFWIADGFSQLNILYKDRWIMISVLGLQSDDRLGLARAAAARMLQRL